MDAIFFVLRTGLVLVLVLVHVLVLVLVHVLVHVSGTDGPGSPIE
jgi:hypothetical protein